MKNIFKKMLEGFKQSENMPVNKKPRFERPLPYGDLIQSISSLLQTAIKHKEMKKKDKVTLKEGEVDKPEPFQHFNDDFNITTVGNGLLDHIDYAPLVQASYDGKAIHCKYDELTGKILYTVIDPYHIEPIDNPQKPLGQETSRLSRTVMNSEIKPVYATIIKAMVLDQLRDIKRNHPEVLKQFLEEDNG